MAAKKAKGKGARAAVKRGGATKKKASAKASPKKASAKRATAKRAAAPPKPKSAKHPIVHWEIQAMNPSLLHAFYRDALGWEIDANNPMQYGMVASGGPNAIGGGIGGAPNNEESRVLVYAQVPSINTMLERIESLGGRIIMPRTDIGPVIMALYQDPESNVMGLIEPMGPR